MDDRYETVVTATAPDCEAVRAARRTQPSTRSGGVVVSFLCGLSWQQFVAAHCHSADMNRDTRLLLYEKELRRLLVDFRDHEYVIFEDSQDDGRFVQYMVHDAAVYGEVGSRHWLPESEGLRKESVTALGCLGFEGGESRRNFSRDHLPHDARRLACLTELLFGAAYGELDDMTPLVRTRASLEAHAPSSVIQFDA